MLKIFILIFLGWYTYTFSALLVKKLRHFRIGIFFNLIFLVKFDKWYYTLIITFCNILGFENVWTESQNKRHTTVNTVREWHGQSTVCYKVSKRL